jgi:hypothetical protein
MESGANCRVNDWLMVINLVSPSTIERLGKALLFQASDFVDTPLDELRLNQRIRKTKRVRGKSTSEGNNGAE